MPTGILTIDRPFTGGLVTDRAEWELAPNEASVLQDVIWPKGVACVRGAWTTVDSDPLGVASPLAGVMAGARNVGQANFLVYGDTAGRIGQSGGGAASYGGAATSYLPRAYWGGEVIFCPQDGVSPMYRYSFRGTSAPVAAAGTVSTTSGSTVVTGVGTTFTTQAPVGTYLAMGIVPGSAYRVTKVDSNTVLSVATPVPLTMAAVAWSAANVGHLGLGTTVTQLGDATAAGAALTGRGTLWFTGGVTGDGSVASGDLWIYRTPGGTYTGITAVTSDTAITLASAPGTPANAAYRITRPAVGREACIHQTRLFWTGVKWAPNRLFYSPPLYDLGRSYNERENFTSNFVDAYPADFRDVPAPGAQGHIEALISSGDPGPLLILRSDSVYALYGNPADPDIRLLADGAGCADLRTACSSPYGQFWAGTTGIWRYIGGQPEDLTAGRRHREWVNLIANRSTTAFLCAGVVEGHLVVCLNDYAAGGTSVTWAYDLLHEAWVGNVSLIARYMFTVRPQDTAGGMAEDMYWITDGTAGNRKTGTMAAVFRDDGVAAATANSGRVVAQTGTNLVPLGSGGRVLDARVVYQTGVSVAPGLTVKTGAASPLGADVDLPYDSADGLLTQRIRAVTTSTSSPTGGVGTSGRSFGMRFEQASPMSRFRIHKIELTVRRKRVRA